MQDYSSVSWASFSLKRMSRLLYLLDYGYQVTRLLDWGLTLSVLFRLAMSLISIEILSSFQAFSFLQDQACLAVLSCLSLSASYLFSSEKYSLLESSSKVQNSWTRSLRRSLSWVAKSLSLARIRSCRSWESIVMVSSPDCSVRVSRMAICCRRSSMTWLREWASCWAFSFCTMAARCLCYRFQRSNQAVVARISKCQSLSTYDFSYASQFILNPSSSLYSSWHLLANLPAQELLETMSKSWLLTEYPLSPETSAAQTSASTARTSSRDLLVQATLMLLQASNQSIERKQDWQEERDCWGAARLSDAQCFDIESWRESSRVCTGWWDCWQACWWADREPWRVRMSYQRASRDSSSWLMRCKYLFISEIYLLFLDYISTLSMPFSYQNPWSRLLALPSQSGWLLQNITRLSFLSSTITLFFSSTILEWETLVESSLTLLEELDRSSLLSSRLNIPGRWNSTASFSSSSSTTSPPTSSVSASNSTLAIRSGHFKRASWSRPWSWLLTMKLTAPASLVPVLVQMATVRVVFSYPSLGTGRVRAIGTGIWQTP